MKLKIAQILFLCLGFFAYANFANAYYNPGQPDGFVNDYSSTLTSEQKQLLENKLTQFERDSSNEISIAIINDLQDDTIENFAEKLFKDWRIGKKDKDNGVLILVAKENREMRIEVGYGLEGTLTDAQSNWIINKIMKPAFQSNDFYKGINDATDKIIAATKGENIPNLETSPKQNFNFDWEMVFGIGFFGLMWLSAILGRSKSWWLGGAIGAILGIIMGIIKGFLYFGITSLAILIPLGLLFDFIVSKQYRTGKSRGHVPWWIGGGRWGSGKSGGFGGFGGGMSGGGGSSGKW
jgi:uncharacterized protein